MRSRPLAYVAAPLFTPAERLYNREIVRVLRERFEVFLPQDDGDLMSALIEDGASETSAACQVFEKDIGALRECEFVIAVLDGPTVDEGVAVELGFAFGLGKRCYGLLTDTRTSHPWGRNPMVLGTLEHTFRSLDELSNWVGTRAVSSTSSAATRGSEREP